MRLSTLKIIIEQEPAPAKRPQFKDLAPGDFFDWFYGDPKISAPLLRKLSASQFSVVGATADARLIQINDGSAYVIPLDVTITASPRTRTTV